MFPPCCQLHRTFVDVVHDELFELRAKLVHARALGVLRVRLVFETAWSDPVGVALSVPGVERLSLGQAFIPSVSGFLFLS